MVAAFQPDGKAAAAKVAGGHLRGGLCDQALDHLDHIGGAGDGFGKAGGGADGRGAVERRLRAGHLAQNGAQGGHQPLAKARGKARHGPRGQIADAAQPRAAQARGGVPVRVQCGDGQGVDGPARFPMAGKRTGGGGMGAKAWRAVKPACSMARRASASSPPKRCAQPVMSSSSPSTPSTATRG
jgi:hypothetical protein